MIPWGSAEKMLKPCVRRQDFDKFMSGMYNVQEAVVRLCVMKPSVYRQRSGITIEELRVVNRSHTACWLFITTRLRTGNHLIESGEGGGWTMVVVVCLIGLSLLMVEVRVQKLHLFFCVFDFLAEP